MTCPTCCNKPAKEYRELYYWDNRTPHSIEQGFRCQVCGSLRLPFGSDQAGYERKKRDDELVYAEGLRFDAELTTAI